MFAFWGIFSYNLSKQVKLFLTCTLYKLEMFIFSVWLIFRRSLAEKVKLFSSLKEEQEKTPPKVNPPVIRRRNRKQLTSRFNTQVGYPPPHLTTAWQSAKRI